MLLSSVPTLRRKKGTEKLAPVICAHAEAEEGYREACSYLLCPRCDGIEAQEGVRRIGKSKDSDLCASAHRCLHYAYARLIARVTFNLQNNNIRAFHIIGEVVHSSGGESQDLRAQNGIGDILHDAGSLAVAQCHICADRIEDDAL